MTTRIVSISAACYAAVNGFSTIARGISYSWENTELEVFRRRAAVAKDLAITYLGLSSCGMFVGGSLGLNGIGERDYREVGSRTGRRAFRKSCIAVSSLDSTVN